MSSPKPISKSETVVSNYLNTGQMTKDFTQYEIVPRASVLEESISHLAGELPSEQNHLTCLSNFNQPQPLNIMFEPPIEVSNSKSTSSSSDSDESYFSPIKAIPLQTIPLETTTSDTQQNVQTTFVKSDLTNLVQPENQVQSETEQVLTED